MAVPAWDLPNDFQAPTVNDWFVINQPLQVNLEGYDKVESRWRFLARNCSYVAQSLMSLGTSNIAAGGGRTVGEHFMAQDPPPPHALRLIRLLRYFREMARVLDNHYPSTNYNDADDDIQEVKDLKDRLRTLRSLHVASITDLDLRLTPHEGNVWAQWLALPEAELDPAGAERDIPSEGMTELLTVQWINALELAGVQGIDTPATLQASLAANMLIPFFEDPPIPEGQTDITWQPPDSRSGLSYCIFITRRNAGGGDRKVIAGATKPMFVSLFSKDPTLDTLLTAWKKARLDRLAFVPTGNHVPIGSGSQAMSEEIVVRLDLPDVSREQAKTTVKGRLRAIFLTCKSWKAKAEIKWEKGGRSGPQPIAPPGDQVNCGKFGLQPYIDPGITLEAEWVKARLTEPAILAQQNSVLTTTYRPLKCQTLLPPIPEWAPFNHRNQSAQSHAMFPRAQPQVPVARQGWLSQISRCYKCRIIQDYILETDAMLAEPASANNPLDCAEDVVHAKLRQYQPNDLVPTLPWLFIQPVATSNA